MNRRPFAALGTVIIGIIVILAIVLASPRTETMTPETVTERFYAWYLDKAEGTAGQPCDVLADHAYQSSGYLAPSLIEQVDINLDCGDTYADFDPFFQAGRVPDDVRVDEAVIAEDTANVTVRAEDRDGADWNLRVTLEQVEDVWYITEIVNLDSDVP